MSIPQVSIIIPVYNQQELFLRESVESAIAQTYKNIEIIISDNHSTNNVPEILAEYAAFDRRVRIVRPTSFLNMADSFMYVFTQVKTPYSCYINSDDILLPDCVEILLEKMELYPETVFAHGQARYFDNDKTYTSWNYFDKKHGVYDFNKEAARRILDFSYICFGGCMVRTAKWNEMAQKLRRADLKIKCTLDILIVLLLFQEGKLYYHNEILAAIRIENETRNSRLPSLITDALTIRNFIAADKNISQTLQQNGINLQMSKKEQFIVFHKELLIQYCKGLFDKGVFKESLENLKLYRLETPAIYKISNFFASRFPKTAGYIFRKLNGIRKGIQR